MHDIPPFSIQTMRDSVPKKIRPWIFVFFVIIIQLSGGIYLAAASEMVGSLALKNEDIMMAGYASTIGMALTFSVMFRMRFRFSIKTLLLVSVSVILLGNIICMTTKSIPLLIATCFVTGFFRMLGTFACNTSIQLWITPTRDLSVFFSYIYLLVQGCIQLSGIITVYIAFFSTWEYMHLLIIALLLVVILLTIILFKSKHDVPFLPLYGIDWFGALLWSVTVLSLVFVLVYGDFYDWFDSLYIWLGTIFCMVSLLLNLWRASFIRHPFIPLNMWLYRPIVITLSLYIVVDILLSPEHLIEHIYMESILNYDTLNLISLNWVVLAGIITGALFTYFMFAVHKWSYRRTTAIAFSAIVSYLVIFYFTIDYNLPKDMLILPLFLRGVGYVIIAIVFLTALSKIPFKDFFQSLTVQAFISASVGGAVGSAVITQIYKTINKSNFMLLSSNMDNLNPALNSAAFSDVCATLQRQAAVVSMKETYGWLALAGIFCMVLFLLLESDIRPKYALHPTYRAIRRLIKSEIKEDKELDKQH